MPFLQQPFNSLEITADTVARGYNLLQPLQQVALSTIKSHFLYMNFRINQDENPNQRRRSTNQRRQSGDPRRGLGFKVLLFQFYIEKKSFFSAFKKDYSYLLRRGPKNKCCKGGKALQGSCHIICGGNQIVKRPLQEWQENFLYVESKE